MTTYRQMQALWLALLLLVLAATIAGRLLLPETPAHEVAGIAAASGAAPTAATLSGAPTDVLPGEDAAAAEQLTPVEWEVLRALAAKHAEPERELARLLAQLRFNKQLAWWQESVSAPPGARREAATRLLAALPAVVTAGDIRPADAHALQQKLVAELENDPQRRADRLATEARRIGIVQSIQSSP